MLNKRIILIFVRIQGALIVASWEDESVLQLGRNLGLAKSFLWLEAVAWLSPYI